MDEITITIYRSEEGGYKYDIYDCGLEEAVERDDSTDGGHCTSTMIHALGMAESQAKDLIEREGDKCPECIEGRMECRMIDVDGTNLVEMLECSKCFYKEPLAN